MVAVEVIRVVEVAATVGALSGRVDTLKIDFDVTASDGVDVEFLVEVTGGEVVATLVVADT